MTEYLARVPTAAGPFDAFISDLARLHERYRNDQGALVEATRLRLAQLVAEPDVLPASACEGSPDRYTQHILHVSPDRSHSVVALVWYLGQRTPIHDHVSWCVVGVYEGEESQTLYRLVDGAGEPCLVETGRLTAERGSCTSLIPPAENIHRVANAGSGRAIIKEIRSYVLASLYVFSLVAVGGMLVSCFGVANLIVAGIQARRFEFGVLRAIGAQRGLIARLVLGEAIIIALGACIVGTAFGYHGAWAGQVMNELTLGFQMTTHLPLDATAMGWGMLTLITVGAALPAILGVNRAKVRELLGAVRG